MFDLFLFIMIINIINKRIFMTTVYIDSILYSPKDYNSMYNYNQYNPFENKQNNILDIINTTKKDDVITGDECFIYKNPDGTLKKMDINGISEMIYKKIEKHLISDHDKKQDTNIKNIKHTVNDINNINIWKNFNGKK